jgi:hypothetical protein
MFCFISSSIYTFCNEHSWYKTKIGITPFYEITEETGAYLKLMDTDSEDNPKDLPFNLESKLYKIEYQRIKTVQSRRRPIRHEITIWQSDSTEHKKIIRGFQNYVDTLVMFPNKSFEERLILTSEIDYLDSVLQLSGYKDSMNLHLMRRAKAKELENNYKVNYVFEQSAESVSSFEYGKFISFWLIPLLIWWSWARYKEDKDKP